jgi:hypothetical protein
VHSDFTGSSDQLHLIERFTRVAPDRIDDQITIDDPTTLTKPWSAVIRLKHTDARSYEYACHEGNYDIVRDMLAGARAPIRGDDATLATWLHSARRASTGLTRLARRARGFLHWKRCIRGLIRLERVKQRYWRRRM